MSSSVRALVIFVGLIFAGCAVSRDDKTPYVSGVVADARTLQPIVNAAVSLNRYQRRPVLTDNAGQFEIAPMPRVQLRPFRFLEPVDDDLYLIITSPGYQPVKIVANSWHRRPEEMLLLRSE